MPDHARFLRLLPIAYAGTIVREEVSWLYPTGVTNVNYLGWRRVLPVGIIALLLLCPIALAKPRVIILGFDGVDPLLVDSMLEKGQLPNLAKVKSQGTYQRLQSTIPPESPVAWSSFSTCKNPGNHGVFDFVGRDPRTYAPKVGFGDVEYPTFAADGSLAKPPQFTSERQGEAFWVAADRQGARCKVFHVPFAFPPDPLKNGVMLCGLGVPDIQGTMHRAFFLSDSYTPRQLAEALPGGVRLPLRFNADRAEVDFPTVRNANAANPGLVSASFSVSVDRASRRVTLEIPGKTVTLQEHEWSDWLEWSIPVTPKFVVKTISRVYILEAGAQVRIYMTCLQQHPRAPYLAISAPGAYSGELADRYGLFKTIGWAFDTFAVRRSELPEDVFLDDVDKSSAWTERLTLDELERGDFDLLVSAWTGTDRAAHLFWRFRDTKHPLYTAEGAAKYGRVVEDTYRQMDGIIGAVMAKLTGDDLLMIMSDHGFHSFRVGFSVNTWLIRNGYLVVQGQTDAATAVNERILLEGYEWTRTKAYSIGLGGIYLNLQGRETKGTVNPEDAPGLIAEMKRKLLELTAPDTGETVFRAIYTRDDFKGTAQAGAPDLQLAYAEGYQTAKMSAKGAASEKLFEPNDDKWSGEHAASDVVDTPGVLFVNRPLKPGAKAPAIIDLGETALAYLGGLIPPAGAEGVALVDRP